MQPTRRTVVLSAAGLGNRMVRGWSVAPPSLAAHWETRAAKFAVAERVAHASRTFYADLARYGVTAAAERCFEEVAAVARDVDPAYLQLAAEMSRDGTDARRFQNGVEA